MRRVALPSVLIVLAGAIAATACRGGKATTAPTATPSRSATAATSEAPAAAPTPAARGTPVAGGYRATRVFPQIDFAQITDMELIPGEPAAALVLTKDGVVRRARLDQGGQAEVFLDIRDRLIRSPGQEEGLLGLAFAPDFTASGTFYLYYTRGDPRHNRVSRFIAQGGRADPASEQPVIDLPEKRFSNHNGGEIVFGPDGYLYIGTGDGGGGGDPDRNGQNTGTLLGKILRIDVSGITYAVPPDNPFARGGGAPEVYAFGLRNPWRFTFDPATGALWAADVGQGKWEEIDRIVAGGNYGWNVMEGAHCYSPPAGCDQAGLLLPRAEYSHDLGCSVTGGYVYRGQAMPELDGWYVYGDYCSGRVWAVDTASADSPPVLLTQTDASISSFFRDAAGELYALDFGGRVLRLERAP